MTTENQENRSEESQSERKNYDSPWKIMLEQSLPSAIEFFFPQMYDDIDWERELEFVSTELHRITHDSKMNKGKVADVLVKVWLKDGTAVQILLHIEVQAQRDDDDFEHRVYVYNYRSHDRFKMDVITLVILADMDPAWRPHVYHIDRWGFRLTMEFPTKKLMDYTMEQLEQSSNPFAMVVMIHLIAKRTRNNFQLQAREKFRLMRLLFQRNYTKHEIINLLRFLDWLLHVPKDQIDIFWDEVQHHGRERDMEEFIWSFERQKKDIWMEEGRAEGRTEGLLIVIELMLEKKFGKDGLELVPIISAIQDIETLKKICAMMYTAVTVDEVRAVFQTVGSRA